MNKKIRAVVKHYEKNMKFESKFEQLSHKLDLIKDDTPLKSDVIVIRRKLIPAYMMTVLVMALVTGLIGLQIGLGNLKVRTEYINPVRVELEKHVVHYLPMPVDTTILNGEVIVNYYVGTKNDLNYLIISPDTFESTGSIVFTYNNESYSYRFDEDQEWIVIELQDTNNVTIEIEYNDAFSTVIVESITMNLTGYFDYIDMMFN